jgi:hypothetical protein
MERPAGEGGEGIAERPGDLERLALATEDRDRQCMAEGHVAGHTRPIRHAQREGSSVVVERRAHRDERGYPLAVDHLALGIDDAEAPISRYAELPQMHVLALLYRERLDRGGVDPRDSRGHASESFTALGAR